MYSSVRKEIEHHIELARQHGKIPQAVHIRLNAQETEIYMRWLHVHLRPSRLEENPSDTWWVHHGAHVTSELDSLSIHLLAHEILSED